MNNIIPYYGGKYFMAKDIIAMFPYHETYIEPFGGGASVLLEKPPSRKEIYNDINSDLFRFFKVFAGGETYPEFMAVLERIPYSRDFFENLNTINLHKNVEIDFAVKYFIYARQGFVNGNPMEAYWRAEPSTDATRNYSKGWGELLGLKKFSKRLRTVCLENRDFSEIISKWDSPKTLIYCDPPYVKKTRSSEECYKFEMTNEDHEKFIDIVLKSKSQIIISGYDSDLYSDLEAVGWNKKFLKVSCNTSNKKGESRDEVLWWNYKSIKRGFGVAR